MSAPTQPRSFNLLELFKAHRQIADTLSDPTSLFVLGFVNEIGETTRPSLQGELALPPDELARIIDNLNRAELVGTQVDRLYVTEGGRDFLDNLGLGSGPVPPPPKPPGPNWGGVFVVGVVVALVGALAIAALIIFSQPAAPSLQGIWLWRSEQITADKGVRAIFTQQGANLSGRAVYPDGTVYLLLEGNVSQVGQVSVDTFWKGAIVPDPGSSPCPSTAVAEFFRKYEDPRHPSYARGTMNLKYDAQTKELTGSKTYFHLFCDRSALTRVDEPTEKVTLTRVLGQ